MIILIPWNHTELKLLNFTMTPNRWKKDFNAIGIIPSSGKNSSIKKLENMNEQLKLK